MCSHGSILSGNLGGYRVTSQRKSTKEPLNSDAYSISGTPLSITNDEPDQPESCQVNRTTSFDDGHKFTSFGPQLRLRSRQSKTEREQISGKHGMLVLGHLKQFPLFSKSIREIHGAFYQKSEIDCRRCSINWISLMASLCGAASSIDPI